MDGHDIKTLDPHWLRNQVGTVSQEPVLFSSTIAENIMYGAPDANSVSLAEIESASQKANAYNFIKSFPNGFDTVVGEKGLMLSGSYISEKLLVPCWQSQKESQASILLVSP